MATSGAIVSSVPVDLTSGLTVDTRYIAQNMPYNGVDVHYVVVNAAPTSPETLEFHHTLLPGDLIGSSGAITCGHGP